MSRRLRKKEKDKKDWGEFLVTGLECIKIDYKNKIVGDRFKTVFYVKTDNCPEGRMCVLWGRTSLDVGDRVDMKGRLTDEGVFLVWSRQVTKEWNYKV